MNSKFFNAHSMSISEYVNLLFSATNNNILKIPRFIENDLSEGPDYYEYFKVDFSDKTPVDATLLCEKYIKVIKLIAGYKKKLGEDFLETIKNTPETYSFWKTYISSLDKGGVDYEKLQEITEMIECENASDEQWAYYDKVMSKRIRNANKRLNNKFYSYEFIAACQRLYKLYLVKAPEAIINNEIISFCEKVILHSTGISSYQDESGAVFDATYKVFKEGNPDELKQLNDKYNSAMKTLRKKYAIEDE